MAAKLTTLHFVKVANGCGYWDYFHIDESKVMSATGIQLYKTTTLPRC